ncbi:unnamed protein product [Kluyveromyces dobzhanskii CBS 2104]|uniref:WGS project CCBQ000000000 data, contig 00008 n=1 Tax=Kluyveromyces dobzhanskii CBS 2104 TaxID=1427455 RepID=A0A0A8L9Q6_9SACH|nr:unnamed protein product [Kluyveromyces dobzhanskii CBS 2104]
MISDEDVSTFQGVCGTDNDELSRHFLEMAGGNLETAISLFFEHGGEGQLNNSSGAVGTGGGADLAGLGGAGVGTSDVEVAEELQRQAYQGEDQYRAPDQARHETLVDTNVFPGVYGGIGGSFEPLRHARDMFDDSRPLGIFNQHLDTDLLRRPARGSSRRNDDDDGDDDTDSAFTDEDNYPSAEDEFEYVEENVVEIDDDGELREYTKWVKKPKPMSKESRLMLLFRPPFDLMAKYDLDTARQKAREKNKWVMINIQCADIFQCQMLNRDLWSNAGLKAFIKENFVFLQYQYDSRLASSYIQRYGFHDKEDCPHIAILDSMTGERLKFWSREVPSVETFRRDLEKFLEEFSLDPTTANPTVKEPTPKLDPSTLSEEKQLELAIKESLGKQSPDFTAADDNVEDLHEADETDSTEATQWKDFNSIEPVDHLEPDNKPGITTRIQVRTGGGERLVRRFDAMHDTVRTIYEVIKSHWPECSQTQFVLTNHTRENLIEKLDESINDAGLKNSSILLEKVTE